MSRTVTEALLDKIDQQDKEIERLRAALKEIRDVARCSDGVDFYAMLAEQALDGDE
jgi:hypothetical protein